PRAGMPATGPRSKYRPWRPLSFEPHAAPNTEHIAGRNPCATVNAELQLGRLPAARASHLFRLLVANRPNQLPDRLIKLLAAEIDELQLGEVVFHSRRQCAVLTPDGYDRPLMPLGEGQLLRHVLRAARVRGQHDEKGDAVADRFRD